MRVHVQGSRKPSRADIQVARRIRAQRTACGLTLMELAAAIGVNFQQIQKYESSADRVSTGRLSQIARVLGVAVTDLLDGYAPSRKEQAKFDRMVRLAGARELLKAFAKIPVDRREEIVRIAERAAARHCVMALQETS